jgi:hypothetical protein
MFKEILVAALLISMTTVAAEAQLLFGSARMHGRLAGIAAWAIHNCGARPKNALERVGRIGRKLDAVAFERGRSGGRAEAARAARKLRSKRVACASLRSTYFARLPDLKLLVDWPPPSGR